MRTDIILSLCLLFIIGCSRQEEAKPSRRSEIVTVDGKPIPNSQTETEQTRQALYDHLCQMYDIRRSAAEAYATAHVLKVDADKNGQTPDAFLQSQIASRLTEQAVRETVNDELIGDWIQVDVDGESVTVSTGSAQGLAELRRRTEARLRQSLIDSLFSAHQVVIDIDVPRGPVKTTTDCVTEPAHSQCDVMLTMVYDLDCANCRKVWRMLKSIVSEYDWRVGIELVDATSGSSLAERMASAARHHGVSEEFVVWLLDKNYMPDSLSMARQLVTSGVEQSDLVGDLADTAFTSEADRRQSKLADMGLLATPKIILNNRLLWRGDEEKILRHEISRALSNK